MMSPEEATAIRNKLGLSVDGLAAELALTPHVVSGWEAGKNRIPSKIARELRWRAAAFDRQKALEESGLAECEWMGAWAEEDVPEKLRARTEHLEKAFNHQKSCVTCQAREGFVRERFGEMPERPMAWWIEAIGWISSRIEKWPAWTQPAVWVGLAFGGYSLIKIVFMLPTLRSNPGLLLTALGGMLLSISIGAAVGLVYGAFGELRARRRTRAT